jgi:hypothetical protein
MATAGNLPLFGTSDGTREYLIDSEYVPADFEAAGAAAAVAGDLTTHTGNTSNPHSVTPAQIGASGTGHNHDLAYDVLGAAAAAAGSSVPLTQRATANGVATLDADTRIPIAQIPEAIALNLGYYATEAALVAAHGTASAGNFCVVGDTDTVWVWDDVAAEWQDTSDNGAVVSVNAKTGAVILSAADVSAATATHNHDSAYDVIGAAGTVAGSLSAHVGAGGTAHAAATTEAAGFMSAADKTKLDAAITTGIVWPYIGGTAPTGWILLTGASAIRTIGDASSGASRANADTEALFALLWDSMTNTEAPVSTGRGASAAADFAAHKTITIPDPRGRAIIGSGEGSGLTARTHGATGGAETHQLSEAELASHDHTLYYTDVGMLQSGTTYSQVRGASDPQTSTFSSVSAGSDSPHNNMQPWAALNLICKL